MSDRFEDEMIKSWIFDPLCQEIAKILQKISAALPTFHFPKDFSFAYIYTLKQRFVFSVFLIVLSHLRRWLVGEANHTGAAFNLKRF